MNAILETAKNKCIEQLDDLYHDTGCMESSCGIYEEVELPHNNVLVIEGELKADIINYVSATYWDPQDFELTNHRFIGELTVYEQETDDEIFHDELTLNLY